ncbi:PH domain-containing protein [Dietzia sp. E1]|uniref:PH domain-containing protein n=1 Tax=Dietzia sp. E1 TaxID=328361 RepID=UPI0015F86B17|nr:PH domain-containing protein [Dietzia sp. E1]MBB1022793.1 PH domain-containing protein [Dietzia sp. E1]
MTTPQQPGWRRLDRRTIPASTTVATGALAAAAVPVAIGMLLSGLAIGWVLLWTVGGTVLGAAAIAVSELIRLAVTDYRVDAHRIEKRVRFLSSTTTSLSTHRVRNVELSADVVQRRLGIATLKLASGETDGSRLTLAALDRRVAEQLRRDLLADRASADTEEIARLDPRWVRYAPVGVVTPLSGLIAFGLVFQVADWFNAVPAMLEWVWDRIDSLPVPVIAVGLVVIALAIGTVAAVAIFVETWWGMRLERHRDGSLELRRGLMVGRHTSFDGRRVRGVTLYEPPGLRAVGAARLDVVAVGVGIGKDEDGQTKQSPALVPASPREVPVRVAEAVLGETVPAVSSRGGALRAHPPVARRRRALRAFLATAALTAIAATPVLVWPWLWWIPVAVAAISGAVAAWATVDNYRGLGHAVGPTLVVLRKGSFLRRTDVVIRDGILGWNVRRTPFQRRAGLVTLVATSAGGGGAFRLPDVDESGAHEVWSTAGDVWDHLATPRD